jgi:hypothetical protein
MSHGWKTSAARPMPSVRHSPVTAQPGAFCPYCGARAGRKMVACCPEMQAHYRRLGLDPDGPPEPMREPSTTQRENDHAVR